MIDVTAHKKVMKSKLLSKYYYVCMSRNSQCLEALRGTSSKPQNTLPLPRAISGIVKALKIMGRRLVE
jgi:hypothetical protein